MLTPECALLGEEKRPRFGSYKIFALRKHAKKCLGDRADYVGSAWMRCFRISVGRQRMRGSFDTAPASTGFGALTLLPIVMLGDGVGIRDANLRLASPSVNVVFPHTTFLEIVTVDSLGDLACM
jgi:hypothetical protein